MKLALSLSTGLLLGALGTLPGHAQRLMELDGIELRGSARVVAYGAATCEIREGFAGDDEAYDPANRGQPLDVWQLDFSVYNGSGKWLDHLIARYEIGSEWPPCSSWDGPPAGTVEGVVEWAGKWGHIQKSGRNAVEPGQTLTETTYLVVFHSDEPPWFARWSLDYDFAVSPPADEGATETPPNAVAGPSTSSRPSAEASRRPVAPQQQDQRCEDWWLVLESWQTTTAGQVADCLAAGADPNARDEAGFGPLLFATLFAGPGAVKELLAAGADPNVRDDRGLTPLGFFVRVLSQKEDSERRGWPGGGHAATVEALLAAGADPNVRDEEGSSLLAYVVQDEVGLQTVEALLAAGADPNMGTRTLPMFWAIGDDDLAAVNSLLAAGADPNAVVSVGAGNWTALHAAAMMSEDPAVVETLLAAGADPQRKADHAWLMTPLQAAEFYRSRYPAAAGVIEALRAATVSAPSRATAARTPQGRCLVPGFPDPTDPESLGFPWCPASVDFQIRVFAISAAGAQCAITTGSSQTPEQIEARNRETADLCARLDAVAERFGGAACRCPADWR